MLLHSSKPVMVYISEQMRTGIFKRYKAQLTHILSGLLVNKSAVRDFYSPSEKSNKVK